MSPGQIVLKTSCPTLQCAAPSCPLAALPCATPTRPDQPLLCRALGFNNIICRFKNLNKPRAGRVGEHGAVRKNWHSLANLNGYRIVESEYQTHHRQVRLGSAQRGGWAERARRGWKPTDFSAQETTTSRAFKSIETNVMSTSTGTFLGHSTIAHQQDKLRSSFLDRDWMQTSMPMRLQSFHASAYPCSSFTGAETKPSVDQRLTTCSSLVCNRFISRSRAALRSRHQDLLTTAALSLQTFSIQSLSGKHVMQRNIVQILSKGIVDMNSQQHFKITNN